jgi:hypothetical protein
MIRNLLGLRSAVAAVPFPASHADTDRRLFLEHYPPTHMFAVVSWGCAGTSWLAAVLNSHPDIYSVHAANIFWEKLAGTPRLDGIPYIRLIGSQGYAHKAAGDVHGVSRDTLAALRKEFGDNFGCAVVVRDPLPRIRSQIALFESFNNKGWGDLSYIDAICEKKGLLSKSVSYEQRLFLHAANMLNAILEEREIAPVYRIEDLTSNPEALCSLVTNITNGKVFASIDWAQESIRRGRINAHIRNSAAAFDAWQRRALEMVVKLETWEAYKALGYEVYGTL